MKCSWLLALASLWSQVQAQSDLVLHWVNADGEPVPASTSLGHTLHVGSWIDGISQSPVQGEDLVVDEEGWCQWPDVKPGVYVLEALPWSWNVVVDWPQGPKAQDTIQLIVPEKSPARLRGNSGVVMYGSHHSGTALDGVQAWVRSTLDSLDLDQLMATGSVGSSEKNRVEAAENLEHAWKESEAIWAEFSQSFAPHGMWGDLFAYESLAFRMSLGKQGWGESLGNWMASRPDGRSWGDRLASPGWCEAWRLSHEGWQTDLEEEAKPWKAWVGTGMIDSLVHALAWNENEVHLMMWLEGEAQPRGPYRSWWDKRWRDQCEVAEARRMAEQTRQYPRTAQSWGDLMWMMPNGDIEPAWASQAQPMWFAWLVVKDGSAMALRERAVLRSFMNRIDSNQMGWGVLAVDDSNEGWSNTLAARESMDEVVHWVGRDPAWWDRLDLQGVPQVILINPQGEIATHQARLPSEGLLADLQRKLKMSNR